MELKTALYDKHVDSQGKIVPFAGYLLPVQYKTGVIAEHMAVRTKAGLFDVSHMGEVIYEGADALKNLNYLLTNDFTSMPQGRVRYSPMCYDNGGVVDDLLVYKYSDEKYLVVVNASNRHKDVAWMKQHLFGDVRFTDISDDISEIALQGPLAEQILETLSKSEDIPEKYYTFVASGKVAGIECIISRTGYTGEKGFELYTKNENAAALWDAVMKAGEPFGLIPCGLGARDTLRLEAAMPLYGHEMDETITPLEAGLGFGVKLQKEGDFVGKKALIEKGEPQRVRVGLAVTGRGIIREHESVLIDGREIGHTTSGTHCPYLNKPVAMALVEKQSSAVGTAVEVIVRGRKVGAEIIPLPFYKRG